MSENPKEIPQPILLTNDRDGFSRYRCPICKMAFGVSPAITVKYCFNCGQRVSWAVRKAGGITIKMEE